MKIGNDDERFFVSKYIFEKLKNGKIDPEDLDTLKQYPKNIKLSIYTSEQLHYEFGDYFMDLIEEVDIYVETFGNSTHIILTTKPMPEKANKKGDL